VEVNVLERFMQLAAFFADRQASNSHVWDSSVTRKAIHSIKLENKVFIILSRQAKVAVAGVKNGSVVSFGCKGD
jgi:hypothetical protein